MSTPSSNFAFLTKLHPLWAELGSVAERVFPIDPRSCVVKMRLLAEDMAQDMAIQVGIQPSAFDSQLALVRELENRLRLDAKVRDMLHLLRKRGNEAAHQADAPIGFTEGLEVLKIGRELALWYHRTFDNQPDYRPGPFIPPDNPSRKLSELKKQVQDLDQQLEQTRTQQAQHQALLAQREAVLQAQLAQEQEMTRQAEAAYAQAEEESSVYQKLAEDSEALVHKLKAESIEREKQLARQEEENARLKERQEVLEQKLLAQGQAPTGPLPVDVPLVAAGSTATPLAASIQADRDARLKQLIERASQAAQRVDLDEAATRLLIDDQLRQAGWEADSQTLHYAKGTRPQEGKNLAIAEWPMPSWGKSGHPEQADYVLFIGLMPVGIVEAKRFSTAVASRISQAERYARAFRMGNEVLTLPWQAASLKAPWPDGIGSSFQLPYAYASNGRAYIQQHVDSSGIHFRDLRRPCNIAHAQRAFHSPEELKAMLGQDIGQAEKALQEQADDYGELSLHYYQKDAIKAIETALAHQKRTALVAMATGTGKTRTCLGLIYRMLRARRFRRILFLVDRTALGIQAMETFQSLKLDRNMPLTDLYTVVGPRDKAKQIATGNKRSKRKASAAQETQVELTTVQAMVRRLLDDENPPSAGAYDCIVVDEAHRGYTPDQDMTDGELIFRDQQDYQSTYRRVLDHFDAVKIALTATPARHTTEIFGLPVYEYSYREAVADGVLVDHDPPIRYETALNKDGIHFKRGETIDLLDLGTNTINTATLEDEQAYDVAAFNRSVLNENFNRVICQALVEDIPLPSEEKTLIFCVNDRHADTVKRLLSEAYHNKLGSYFNQASIEKITGQAEKPNSLISRFKNEVEPTIAITVDLLTTGIDVAAICNLVFLRKVKSRILYEQMLGRATRLCPEIGKEAFRIYDAVDLYATLQPVSSMQPLVRNPDIPLSTLCAELLAPMPNSTRVDDAIQQHRQDVGQQLVQKVSRLMTRVLHRLKQRPSLQGQLDHLQEMIGMPAADLPAHLRSLSRHSPRSNGSDDTEALKTFLQVHPKLINTLEALRHACADTDDMVVLSAHEDKLTARVQDYGPYQRPEDYLEAFGHFIREQLNQSVALNVIVNRPRDMTREQLREVKLLLDEHEFQVTTLKKAWSQQSNQEIAAEIVAYIRRAALGEAFIPFPERVDHAMQHVYGLREWNREQRRWLDRIAKQLKENQQVVVDAEFLQDFSRNSGGPDRLNRILDDQLETVRDTLASHLWGDTA